MIKAVLFDLDGTLVNSLEDLANSANNALRLSGFPTHDTGKYKYFVGDGIPKLIERILPEDLRTKAQIEETLKFFMDYYRIHYVDKTYVYDGIFSLILELKRRGYKLAVISNKAQEMALTVVDKLLGDVFDVVCGKQEGYPAKPHPALTLKVIEQLGALPQECVLVGDSGMDAAAAVNAGCTPIGVLWGFRQKEELEQNGAKYIAKKPEEILDIIEAINI